MAEIHVAGMTRRGPVEVEDIRFDGPDGLAVEAYLVRPVLAPASPGPGLLLWHWLDSEAPDGNRSQYLDEAAIRAEVGRLRAGLDLLAARPDVDPDRIGIVGHDFGGMLAVVAASEEPRVRALAIVAATPRWGDWFLPFWQIADDRIDYLRRLRPLDPIERIGRVVAPSVLFQFAERDFYIAPMSGREFARAAPDGAELRMYDTGHDMRLPEIRNDRLAFLTRTLIDPVEAEPGTTA